MRDRIVADFIRRLVGLKAGRGRFSDGFVEHELGRVSILEQQTLKKFEIKQLTNLARQVKKQSPSPQIAVDGSIQREHPEAADEGQDTSAAAAGASQQQPAPAGHAWYTRDGKSRLVEVGQQAKGEVY